jgi:hypothetical protein
MTRRAIAIAALAFAAGCGSVREAEPELPFRSGERLRARLWGDRDGAANFDGWYDSLLELACEFRTAEDGLLRCLPVTSINCPSASPTNEADPSEFVAGEAKLEPSSLPGLDVRTIVAEDGAWFIQAVHSEEFDSDCLLARTDRGTVCLPLNKTDAIDPDVFGDASCELPAVTSALGPSGESCDRDPEFFLAEAEGCPYSPRPVYAVGETVAGEFRPAASGCVEIRVPGDETRLVGEAIPSSRFVALEDKLVGRGLMRARYASDRERPLLVGEAFFDAATGDLCHNFGSCDGTIRCVAETSLKMRYEDAACTKLLFDYSPPSIPTPCGSDVPARRVAMHSDGDSCLEYFEVGARVLPEAVYTTYGGGCEQIAPERGTLYYELRPLPDSAMPIVEYYTE